MKIRGIYINKGLKEVLDTTQEIIIERVEKLMEKGMSNEKAMQKVYSNSRSGWLVWCYVSINYYYVPQNH